MTATLRKWLFVGLIPLLACLACLFALQIKEQKTIPFCVEVESAGMVEEISVWENADGEYYVFLPGYADAANVRIKLNTAETVCVNDIQLSDGMTCEAFEVDELYELKFSAWGEEQIRQVTFVQSANVATMCIDTASGSMKYIHAEKGNEETGKIRLYTTDGSLNYDGELESINGRGNSTWTVGDKKPYNIKLKQEGNLLNMGSAQKWVLLANAYDLSNIRNKMVYDFADTIGLVYSPDSQWVDLYLNGEYVGLYLLSEKNEVHAERVVLQENGSFLVSAENEVLLEEKEETYVLTNAGQAMRIHYADEKMDVKGILQSIENALLAEDGIDRITGKSWMELIDLDSWARKYLIEEFFANTDGGSKSQFYYYDGADERGLVYAGPVWDYDAAAGSEVSWQIPMIELFYANRPMVRKGEEIPWFYSLYKKEEFLNRVTEIYQTEFLPLLPKLLEENIEEYVQSVVRSARLDDIRWNKINSFKEAVEDLKQFLQKRESFLTELWLSGKNYYTVTVYPEIDTYHILYYPVEQKKAIKELPQLEDTQYQTFLGWYYADTDLPFDSTAPITEDIEIYAKWADSSYKRKEQIFKLTPLAIIACMGVGILWADIRRMRKGG